MSSGQGVVSGHGKVLRDIFVDTFPVMAKGRGLSMQNFTSDIDATTKTVIDALPCLDQQNAKWVGRYDSLSHTDAQHRDLPTEMFDSSIANTGICLRMTGSRTDDQLGRILCY